MEMVYSPQDSLKSQPEMWRVPNYIAPGIFGVDYDELVNQGVKHLIFDVDNTLVSFGEPKLTSKTTAFLSKLEQHPGIESLHLASNSMRNMNYFREALSVPVQQATWRSFKPMHSFYRRLLASVRAKTGQADQPGTVAMIGDKLIQDIWGANSVGMVSVLVKPLGRDNLLDVLIRTRTREKRLLRKYLPHHIERWF